MSETQVVPVGPAPDIIELVITQGDLARLKPAERVAYYKAVCDSLSINGLTRPFEFIQLNNKLTLYARKDCTDQLRHRDSISIEIIARELTDGIYVVTARATTPGGRQDESIGAVPVQNLTGEAKANAFMKAESKSKRRATLSICGLGFPSEEEIEGASDAVRVDVDHETGEIRDAGDGGTPQYAVGKRETPAPAPEPPAPATAPATPPPAAAATTAAPLAAEPPAQPAAPPPKPAPSPEEQAMTATLDRVKGSLIEKLNLTQKLASAMCADFFRGWMKVTTLPKTGGIQIYREPLTALAALVEKGDLRELHSNAKALGAKLSEKPKAPPQVITDLFQKLNWAGLEPMVVELLGIYHQTPEDFVEWITAIKLTDRDAKEAAAFFYAAKYSREAHVLNRIAREHGVTICYLAAELMRGLGNDLKGMSQDAVDNAISALDKEYLKKKATPAPAASGQEEQDDFPF